MKQDETQINEVILRLSKYDKTIQNCHAYDWLLMDRFSIKVEGILDGIMFDLEIQRYE